MEPSSSKLPDAFGPRAFGPGAKKTKGASDKLEQAAQTPLHNPSSHSTEKLPEHTWHVTTNDLSSDILPHEPLPPLTTDQPLPHDRHLTDEDILAQLVTYLETPDKAEITKEEFLKLILEKDGSGSPRIFRLDHPQLLKILNLIKERKLPQIDLNVRNSAGTTLFIQLLKRRRSNQQVIKLMCEINPSCLDQLQENTSLFMDLIIKGHQAKIDVLFKAMEDRNMGLSAEQMWIKRACRNDLAFSDDEFDHLDLELKEKIFFTANSYGHEEMVGRLKSLRMGAEPLFGDGPSMFADNMDIITTRGIAEGFLKGLRQKGLLLTEAEAEKLDKTKYVCKNLGQIGRIQGRDFIEKQAQENGLTHIKVPKKIAVINQGLEDVSLRIKDEELAPIDNNQFKIYAERIESVERTVSLEEAVELIIISEKTGYHDYFERNYIIAKDGIYLIDTEFNNFSKAEFAKFYHIAVASIGAFLDPKDHDKFLEICTKRREAYNKEIEIRNAQVKASENSASPYSDLLYLYEDMEFTFLVASLLVQ